MTRCTLSFHSQPLNCSAFRTGTGLRKMAFAAFDTRELEAKHPARQTNGPQFRASVAQPQHHGPILAGLASRFPHRAHPDPAASS